MDTASSRFGRAALADTLERWMAGHGVVLLHGRRVPGGRANIDHLAVGPAGVVVMALERCTGRIAVERRRGLLGAQSEHLLVGRHDRTKLVDGLLDQARLVRDALHAEPDVPVEAVLCLDGADWPRFSTFAIRGVRVLPPHEAARVCAAPGPLDEAHVQAIAAGLAAALHPA
jgi:hypothetical protein